MKRASFTVETKKGIRYDANHLTIAHAVAEGEVGQISMVHFVCSGSMMSIPASEIQEVIFHPAGAQFCGECDESLYNRVGAGIHAEEHHSDAG